MQQEHPLRTNRSFFYLLIPIGFMALIMLSGTLLYQMDKNKILSEKRFMMEQRIQSQQAAPLRNNNSCKAN